MRRLKQIVVQLAVFAAAFVIAVPTTLVLAACPDGGQSCSTNFRVDETFFGSGGELEACSTGATGYCAKQSAGELTVGKVCSNSGDYCAQAGFNTTDQPFLEFVVTGNTIDLGYLDETQPKTATGEFFVRAWQSGGYVVRTESNPPTNESGHQLTPLSGGDVSSPGSEQFGINLAANTSPSITGSTGPQQLPNSAFSFGYAEPGYDIANTFKYNKGDIVARSDESSSITRYVASYLFNISLTTPSGQYVFRHTLVATATY